jgi:hypothetical protein
MAAATDRDRSDATTAPPAAPDFEAMKRDIHRELLSRIKSDFERGG